MASIIAERKFQKTNLENANLFAKTRKNESTKNAKRVHSELNEFGEAEIEMDGIKFILEVQKGKIDDLKFDPFLELRLLKCFGISMTGVNVSNFCLVGNFYTIRL